MSEILTYTLGGVLDQAAERFPENDALVYVERGIRYSYRELNDRCRELAKGLLAMGVRKGDHVAIWANNVPEWVLVQFATAKIGAVLVTVNTSYMSSELEYVLRQSDASTVILVDGFKGTSYSDILYEVVPELSDCAPGALESERLPHLKNVVFIDDQARPGAFRFSDIAGMKAALGDPDLEEVEGGLQADEVINMQYTSGTTGFPKGVMLTHVNVVNNGFNVGECMRLTSQDRLCIPVPFFHCFGCVLGVMACVTHGATMVPIEIFEPAKVLEVVESERCTALHGVPTMFIAELDQLDKGTYDLSSLRTGIMAGAPCPIEVMRRVMDEMHVREITIAYGQTESSPVITQTRTEDPIELRVRSVGRALPDVEVKIVDPVSRQQLPHGQQGELCTRGYLVMRGYHRMPQETAEAIDSEGWLHTGDLAVMDEGGYCRITGRIKDMIIRGGENVYPREIEEFLHLHPDILDVQVFGVPDQKYGEEVAAAVILRQDAALSEEGLREHCRAKIARHKVPRYVRFVDSYPMTASGKVQKHRLREMAVLELGLQEIGETA
ncbi:MAG: AMP-binding protein [Actinobacteria bacterium]|nr:AMP-binding protein [Actinomycetota bacterium]